MSTVEACIKLDLAIKASMRSGKVRMYIRRVVHSVEWAARYREIGDLVEARRCIEDAKAAYGMAFLMLRTCEVSLPSEF